MTPTITSELVEAYSLCPRKAFLLMAGTANPGPHEYVKITEDLSTANRQAHQDRLTKAGELEPAPGVADLSAGRHVLVDVELTTNEIQARCDFLKIKSEPSQLGRHSYEPMRVIGTYRPSRSEMIGLAYRGLVLGQVQGRLPASGTLVCLGDRLAKVKLAGKYKEVKKIVEVLKTWIRQPGAASPPLLLNKHCPSCPYRDTCLQEAEKEDNLSLLDRMTPKLMRKYQDKGIFTVKQLSHLYKPRRNRKQAKRPVRHSLELQALAIRTDKIYVEHLPELPRGPVELFLDLEGVPDRDEYYLAGLLVYRDGEAEFLSFWTDDAAGEAAMWSALAERLAAFPDAPVYHYGNYEKKAFGTLAKRYGKGKDLVKRLVNVAASVYGEIYFPVRSNSLKSLGRFLGATWTAPEASGLQSLVWRHRWEATQNAHHKQTLLRYNHEDCEAVRLLVEHLRVLKETADTEPAVDFARRPKQTATELGKEAHRQFERILREAEEGGHRRSVRMRAGDTEGEAEPKKKRGAPAGHHAYYRIIPSKANRAIRVSPKRKCPKGHGNLVLDADVLAKKTITDLVFTRNGCRKTVIRYEGLNARCPTCGGVYKPPTLSRLGNQVFGHAFKAWAAYQRVVLRLPYRIIAQVTEHLFGIGLCGASPINFLRDMAAYYAPTEAALLQAILKRVQIVPGHAATPMVGSGAGLFC